MVNVTPKYDKGEYARRGEELFERKIRGQVHGEDPQKYLAIDIESGDFEVDPDMLPAIDRLRERHPEAQVWIRRVGSPYAAHLGCRSVDHETRSPGA